MTDKNQNNTIELSRRKILGATGAIGIAGLGAGIGTSAFFSDEEAFTNNQIVAGELDMKVAWEEHYSDWSEDELEGIPEENVTMTDGPFDPGPRSIPGVDFNTNADVEQFKENTLVESGGNLECPETPGVTEGDMPPRKVIDLDDVKPGDEGEVTFSFRLCDNPGYVWLNGRLVDASENGKTEPERKDEQEEDGKVELLDEIQTVLWYDDDGDNIYEQGMGDKDQPLDCVMVLDTSENLSSGEFDDLIEATRGMVEGLTAVDTEDNVTVGIVTTGGGATLEHDLDFEEENITESGGTLDRIKTEGPGGGNDLEGGIRQGHEELLQGNQFDDRGETEDLSPEPENPENARNGVPKIMIVINGSSPGPDNTDDNAESDPDFGDADPRDNADAAKEDDPPVQIITVDAGGGNPAGLLKDLASSDALAFTDPTIPLPAKLEGVVKAIGSEEWFFRGSCRELLDLLASDAGLPLDGNRISSFAEVTGTDSDDDGLPDEDFGLGDGDSEARECFPAAPRTHHIGFQWWLPLDHGNEVQSDSVTFDLGFYTEQCRHNDGSGLDIDEDDNPPID